MNHSRTNQRSGGIPRGHRTDGLPLLSYGFRPFFLGAGLFAGVSMVLWTGAVTLGWNVGGTTYGAVNWHAHEMISGYSVAALAGFMLTAIPNWTGRLPVSGPPLLALTLLWVAGRIAMLVPDSLGLYPAAMVDALFLPALAVIAGREIITGRNWKNLKILAALGILSGLNVTFHMMVLTEGDTSVVFRAAIAVLVALIAVVGGRIVPSFTRNFLSKAGAARMPHSFDVLDRVAIGVLIAALISWAIVPDNGLTAVLSAAASALQLWRLLRWRGHATVQEPLLAILHCGYAFIPISMAAVALAAMGQLSSLSALHLLTVGAIGTMTVAVMTRATLGHTGRELSASALTTLTYVAIIASGIARPLAELLPEHYQLIIGLSGGAWILAFASFSIEYGRMLLMPSAPTRSKVRDGNQPRSRVG